MIQVSPSLNNPKDLDPSYKMDLDFWDYFGRKLTPSFNRIDIVYYGNFQRKLYRTVTEIPENLTEVMDQETFTKARLYNLDKSNFGFWVGLWGETESSVSKYRAKIEWKEMSVCVYV